MTVEATISLSIEFEVSGQMCPAEPDVGIPGPYAEDIEINIPGMGTDKLPDDVQAQILEQYQDEIQEALLEVYAAGPDPDDERDRLQDRRQHQEMP